MPQSGTLLGSQCAAGTPGEVTLDPAAAAETRGGSGDGSRALDASERR